MSEKIVLLMLLHWDLLMITSPSIAGVTYMDEFDFEQRYRDVNECNPFYWHPLHLPEICADMFEKLIRSRIANRRPVRVMRERQEPDDDITRYSYSQENADYSHPIYDIGSVEYESEYHSKSRHQAPYEKMLELLKKDIRKDPSLPKLGVLPNLGPVAIYNQEVSKKSEAMIKELATAYARYGQKSYASFLGYNDEHDPQLYVWDSKKNTTKANKAKKNKQKETDRLSRIKTKYGDVVTVVETLNPRKKRSLLQQIFGL